jgi:putative ATP-grasp target RiPP
LPPGAAYFRGDLAPLRDALSASGARVTLTPPGAAATVAEVNAATLRIDPDTQAAMVADAGDPAINYVLLGTSTSAGTPRLADSRPSALRK